MRWIAVTSLLLLGGCPSLEERSQVYDPRLYDANGDVIAVAPAPQPECREADETVVIDGQTQHAHRMACREPDGRWRLVP
jgi:surface antigen